MIAKNILRPEQEEAVNAMIAEPTHGILLASEMGTGKTSVAAEFAVRLDLQRVLLIGVKDTFAQWSERLEAQSDGGIKLRRIDSTKAGKQAFADFLAGADGYFFAGSQMLVAQDWEHHPVFKADGKPLWKTVKTTGRVVTKVSREIGPREIPIQESERYHRKIYSKMRPVDAIIFDEVHVVANRKAVGRKTLVSIKTDWRLAMSGTWYRNSFEGAWSITRWIWPAFITPRFSEWSAEWCATEDVYLPGGKVTAKVTGEKHPGLFVTTLPLYIRAEAEEQPPAPELVYVELTEEQRYQYEALENDLLVYIETHAGTVAVLGDIPPVLRSRLRTATLGEMSIDGYGKVNFDPETVSSKLWKLRGVLDSEDFAGRPVIIGTHDKRFAKVTVARMQRAGYRAVEWSGDVSTKQRDRIKEQFLAGEIDYIVCVISAFAAGLDGFQMVCNRVVWISESEDPTDNAQFIKRTFRPGRIGDFKHVKIIARNTHDEGIYSKLVMATLNSRRTMTLAA